MRALPLLLVLSSSLLASASVRAQAVALLPSVGGASDTDRKAVDTALRRAFTADDEVKLQSSSDTKRHVLSLAEMGLVCLTDDVPCLCKLGLAADVALVLVPVVEVEGGRSFRVEIGVIDVPKSGVVRSVRAAIDPSKADEVEDLVDKALGRTTTAGRDPDPPPDGDPVPDPDPNPDPDPTPVGGEPMSLSTVGFIVAGVGGGVLALGLGGAAFCELAYAGIIGGFDADTRATALRPAGIALWITGAVGAVALGSGLVLALVASPPEAE